MSEKWRSAEYDSEITKEKWLGRCETRTCLTEIRFRVKKFLRIGAFLINPVCRKVYYNLQSQDKTSGHFI